VRAGSLPARARTQASIAVSADRRRWLLVNATPDIGAQMRLLAAGATSGPGDTDPSGASGPGDTDADPSGVSGPGAADGARFNPASAVLLSDAELDHVTGLLSMREGSTLVVYATGWILRAAAPILDILNAYVQVDRRELAPDTDVVLDDETGLSCRTIATGSTKRPRYAAHEDPDPAAVVGYRFTHAGASLAYVPCLPALTDALVAELKGADCAFLDGTCWTDDELSSVGLSHKTSRSMGHAPVTGPGGTLDRLAALSVRRRVYTHLNNTNPVLVEDSPERRLVEAAGVEVAYDGMEIELP
jgi:pyrroloquinoline quinone biosynthesis protein B